MPVRIKTGPQIDRMRVPCRRLGQIFDALGEMIRPGVSTFEIDAEGERLIREAGGVQNTHISAQKWDAWFRHPLISY